MDIDTFLDAPLTGFEDGLFWVLEGITFRKARTRREVNQTLDDPKRALFQEYLAKGEVIVSTVFLCMNHGVDREDPILFETMIFSEVYPSLDKLFVRRYRTYHAAARGHGRAVAYARRELAKLGIPPDP